MLYYCRIITGAYHWVVVVNHVIVTQLVPGIDSVIGGMDSVPVGLEQGDRNVINVNQGIMDFHSMAAKVGILSVTWEFQLDFF